ncbi:hypothetical protein JIN77_11475 [Verrucomicrobiaceae bacterium R5-34]|nr:hypothetical protein [Verrucomicrobiaceae bacterium R5-34]
MMKCLFPLFFSLSLSLTAAPTAQRVWTSTAGTTVEASAVSYQKGSVSFKTSAGRVIRVPLEKLVADDQTLLREHFGIVEPKPGEPTSSERAFITDDFPHPVGEASGPIEAGNGSNYYIYVPKTLRKDRPVPLMIYTSAGGGKERVVNRYKLGAELNGWIIASPVESKNGPSHPEGNYKHSKQCFEHLIATLPIDQERIYFSGDSGGGAMAFYNAMRIQSAGIMPFVAYSPENNYKKKHYCYSIGGASDFNRYSTARAAAQYGKRGIHRFVKGGHTNGPEEAGVEGMVWLNGMHLADTRKDSELDDDRLDFESTLINWIKELTEETPHRAYYWCDFLVNHYEIEGKNASLVGPLMKALEKDPNNARYVEGLEALDDFSDKYFTSAQGASSLPRINKALEKLSEKYIGVPYIEMISLELAKPMAKPK